MEELKGKALALLLSKDCVEREQLQLSNQKLNRLQDELGQLIMDRKIQLQKANDFFSSANKVSIKSNSPCYTVILAHQ